MSETNSTKSLGKKRLKKVTTLIYILIDHATFPSTILGLYRSPDSVMGIEWEDDFEVVAWDIINNKRADAQEEKKLS